MGCGGSKATKNTKEEEEGSEPEEDSTIDHSRDGRDLDSPIPRGYNNYNSNHNNYNSNHKNYNSNHIGNGYYSSTNARNGNHYKNSNTHKHSNGTQTNRSDGTQTNFYDYESGSEDRTARDSFSDPNEKQGYKKRIRNELIAATAGTNLEVLTKCIEKFESNRIEDCGDLTRAKERLQYLQLRRNLRDAIRRRNISVLQRAISDAKNSRYASQLRRQIEAAQRKLNQLQKLNKYSHDILNMDRSTIAEIHSYPRPPACVHDVMAASYMLLGHDERNLRDWSYLQAAAGKPGRGSLIHQVRDFDQNNVDDKTTARVKEILGYHDLGEVRVASNGAATFHVWATNIVDMIEKERGDDDDYYDEYEEEEDEENVDDEDDNSLSGRKKKTGDDDDDDDEKLYSPVKPVQKTTARSKEKRR